MAGKFSNQLKKFRKASGLTQAEVADILDVGVPRISEWEREVRKPKSLTRDGIMARLDKVKIKKKK